MCCANSPYTSFSASGGTGKKRRSAESSGKFLCEFGVTDRIGPPVAFQTPEISFFHGKREGFRHVVHVNPGHPLFAGTEFAAEKRANAGTNHFQRAAVFAEHETNADLHDAHAEASRAIRFRFPRAAGIGEKSVAGH